MWKPASMYLADTWLTMGWRDTHILSLSPRTRYVVRSACSSKRAIASAHLPQWADLEVDGAPHGRLPLQHAVQHLAHDGKEEVCLAGLRCALQANAAAEALE